MIYTDALQTVIMVGGALVLMFLGKKKVYILTPRTFHSSKPYKFSRSTFHKIGVLTTPKPSSLAYSQSFYQFKPRGSHGARSRASGDFSYSVSPTGFQEVGWYPGLQQLYRQSIPNVTVPNTTCHLPRPDAFHMLRDPVNGDIPWPGLIFGLTVLATWCWCTDQVMSPAWLGPAGTS